MSVVKKDLRQSMRVPNAFWSVYMQVVGSLFNRIELARLTTAIGGKYSSQ